MKRTICTVVAMSIFCLCNVFVAMGALPNETVITNENFDGDNPNLSNWSIATGMRTNIDIFEIGTDPVDANNKVMELTYRGDTVKSGGSTNFQYSFTDIPGSEKLYISYRVKLIDSTNIIANNYPFIGLAAASTNSTTLVPSTSIMNNGGVSSGVITVAKNIGENSSNVSIGNGITSTWSDFSCVIDFTTKEIKYFRSGVQIDPSQHYYLYGTGFNTFDRIVILRFFLRETASWDGKKEDAKCYVDDIVIKRVPSLQIECANQATDVDPTMPLVLNFSTPINKQTLLNTIEITENGVRIENALDIVLGADLKSATITPVGYLKYGKSYKLNISNVSGNADKTLLDKYSQTISAPFEYAFQTKPAKGINIIGSLNVNPSDSANQPVSLSQATKIVASVNINNPTSNDYNNLWLLLGAYGDGDKLLGFQTKSVASVTANSNLQNQVFTLTNLPIGTKKVKAFLWETANGIVLSHKPVEYEQ